MIVPRIFFILLLPVLSGCVKNSASGTISSIRLPSTPLFTNTSQWGFITAPYVRVYRKIPNPSRENRVILNLRQNDIVEITSSRRFGRKGELWFGIRIKDGETGWLDAKRVKDFTTLQQVKAAIRVQKAHQKSSSQETSLR